MKWDFFYNEGNGKSYRSFEDWYNEIKHLVIPFIAIAAICLAILVRAGYFLG